MKDDEVVYRIVPEGGSKGGLGLELLVARSTWENWTRGERGWWVALGWQTWVTEPKRVVF